MEEVIWDEKEKCKAGVFKYLKTITEESKLADLSSLKAFLGSGITIAKEAFEYWTDGVSKAGMLTKQKGKGKSKVTKRYCVYKNRILYYFKKEGVRIFLEDNIFIIY